MGKRFLLIDDAHLTKREGLTRTMHAAKKHPANPVLLPDRSWEGGMAVVSNSVVYVPEERVHKMWYWCDPGHGLQSCLALSTDGLHWDRPELGLVEHAGSRRNNLLEPMLLQVVHGNDAAGPPDGFAYRSMCWTAEKGQHALFSQDGLRWQEGGSADFEAGDTFRGFKSKSQLSGPGPLPGSPELGGARRYLGIVRACCPVGRFDGSSDIRPTRRVQVLIQSDDWLHWTSPTRILTPDGRDDEIAILRVAQAMADGSLVHRHPDDVRAEFYTLYVWPYEDLYLGLLLLFYPSYEFHRVGGNNQAGPGELQLVASRDLYDWRRLGDREPFIPRGGPGSFDWAGAWYACPPVLWQGELVFTYTGVTVTHAGSRDPAYMTRLREKIARGEIPATHSVGVATLRRDGFVSLRAANEPGRLETAPFRYNGGGLRLNADARRGMIQVEALQPDGSLLASAAPLYGVDGTDIPVELESRRSAGGEATHGSAAETAARERSLPGALAPGLMIRLRITMTNADLYSYWFEPAAPLSRPVEA